MSDSIDPVRPPFDAFERDRRRRARRAEDGARPAPDAAPPVANLPVLAAAGPAIDPLEPSAGSAAFAAQILGQPGQKRGLRGGPETLEKARAAYLEAEYSGPDDRRLPTGYVKRSDV